MSALETLEMDPSVAAGGERDNKKLSQILDGARRVFFAEGFDGASMNDVARAAGVSKGTLYVYFGSKQALFAALVRADHAQQAERVCVFDDDDSGLEVQLKRFGVALMTKMCAPDALAHLRAVLAVASKFPEVGRAFYEAGPQFGIDRLAAYLSKRMDAGVLERVDPEVAASAFVNLIQGHVFKRLLFRMSETAAPEEIESAVDSALDLFMKMAAPR